MDLTMWDCQTEVAHLLCSRICGVALRMQLFEALQL